MQGIGARRHSKPVFTAEWIQWRRNSEDSSHGLRHGNENWADKLLVGGLGLANGRKL